MKKNIFILFTVLLSIIYTDSYAETRNDYVPRGGARLMMEINGNDTVYLAFINDLWVFPRNNFKSKAQEKFFWRTVRDVKRTLPYAKLIANELSKINNNMAGMQNDKARKKYLNEVEKDVFKKYEPEMRKMTVNQGRLLLKLIDRECDRSSYELIKTYRGNISAFFWQGVALVFGSNLKTGFDANNSDKLIERVIILVEAGQL
ncbi:MAG: DUF4294 domain-containing protein [Paludibacter sp.]|nr:DUF4294 domain-containing protein [Paludibacter sp.]